MMFEVRICAPTCPIGNSARDTSIAHTQTRLCKDAENARRAAPAHVLARRVPYVWPGGAGEAYGQLRHLNLRDAVHGREQRQHRPSRSSAIARVRGWICARGATSVLTSEDETCLPPQIASNPRCHMTPQGHRRRTPEGSTAPGEVNATPQTHPAA